MKRIALAVSLLAFAATALAAGEKETAASASDPMAGWVPPKVKNERQDKKEILALFKSMENAEKKGDLNAAAALVDFPVLMVTDDSKGQAMSGTWDRERWTKVMEPFYKHPMQDVKVTHKPSIFMVTDSLASVDDQTTMKRGNKTTTARNSSVLVRKDGKWLVKSMMEGGWGDVMKENPAAAAQEPAPSSGPAGTGTSPGSSTGMGTGTAGSAAGAQGQGQEAPSPPQGSSSDTTK